jgi:hypothetical protein
MPFVVRGRTGANESDINPAWVDRYTYLSEPHAGFYQWDGVHRAKLFFTPKIALAAVAECVGPIFRAPMPRTIEAVELDAARRADRQCAEDQDRSR